MTLLSRDYRRCPKTAQDFRGEIRKFSQVRECFYPIFEWQIMIYNAKIFHEKPSKHLTVFSPETVNIKN